MKEVIKEIVVCVIVPVLAIAFIYLGMNFSFEKELIRDCSMTRVHIIDDNTLISCTVLKVNRTETPVQDNKKPEVTL